MTFSLMIQGTASDVGKSVLVAGFCRIFSQDGYHCAPFKSQNMALNSGITRNGEEMGRAQIFQAEAAGIEPDVRMNPILLKPTSDRKSQVILMGKVAKNMDAAEYHQYKPQLKAMIYDVYNSLAAKHDIIVLEGAGSPAEINLRNGDIVNMGMAEMIDAPVILVADIDRGGVFASIYGTLALLTEQERARVLGIIINKFRGDVALLMPGIKQIEELTNVPVLGVLPWLDVDLEDEDGVALQVGKYNGKTEEVLDIVVVQLPHIANFTDFNALAAQPDVRLRYESDLQQIGKPDLLIIPGSKNTLGDLLWLRQKGMDKTILNKHAQGIPIVGICGGYQILGKHIYDDVESGLSDSPGLKLLDITTHFSPEKRTTQTSGTVNNTLPGIWSACQNEPINGYEIHMGVSTVGSNAIVFAQMHEKNHEPCNHADGAVSLDGSVMGSYLHGIFDRNNFTRPLLNKLREKKGLEPLPESTFDYALHKEQQFNILAQQMRKHLNIDEIYRLMRAHREKIA
ncbi:cobyric acid synthase [Providencia stuartii]|uniref:Cobyric acid synthase n=2 Tax=Providencia stuartii TaxID=588 RepID=A0AAJ1JG72_PROST|nr:MULTISPECIES: cobyric acid synthase [Providencia]EMA3640666.1 cobyric acid synthase [Providencia stuartii]MBW3099517.1 cobyric acid synthase [Providencia stuartii]MCB5215734.1 cobyric acid synthase [Providencia stuartii]MDE5308612.1 cobyric acid synthase [Providencia stuartii]MDE8749460.1 cobyric acid synthase [Providencia thailandensis]